MPSVEIRVFRNNYDINKVLQTLLKFNSHAMTFMLRPLPLSICQV